MADTQGAIDVHHHVVSAGYRDRLAARSTSAPGTAGIPAVPLWTADASLAWMDAAGVGRALLSPASRGFGVGDHGEVVGLARAAHEDLLRCRESRPERFGVLTPVPLPALDDAVAHVDRALTTDGADGVALLTQYAGVHVGRPEWDDLLAVLDAHGALVHLHPTAPADAPLRDLVGPHLVEYVFDTTRVALLLAKRHAFSRYPRIRWVLAHGGGTLPFVAGRVDDPPGTVDGAERMVDVLDRCCFDTALLAPPALAALLAFAGADRVVFGSDVPFVHGDRGDRLLDDLTETLPDEDARRAVRSGSARRLLGDYQDIDKKTALA